MKSLANCSTFKIFNSFEWFIVNWPKRISLKYLLSLNHSWACCNWFEGKKTHLKYSWSWIDRSFKEGTNFSKEYTDLEKLVCWKCFKNHSNFVCATRKWWINHKSYVDAKDQLIKLRICLSLLIKSIPISMSVVAHNSHSSIMDYFVCIWIGCLDLCASNFCI